MNKYLSIDIEATGLKENCYMIEFAAVAIDAHTKIIDENISFHSYIRCPSFEDLKPSLDQWVIENNKELITEAHSHGLPLSQFKKNFETFLENDEVKNFFGKEKIILFGKSMNAIDLPFMNRDLGWEWMRTYFSHRVLDFTSTCYSFVDIGILPQGMESGSALMKHFGMGEVAHTALEDAINTAKMYFRILEEKKPS
ncbi:MAG: 3'-5' exoribonuclease [Halobacteriovoraceae bacterium]|nr:3'-5' exoribonuclease [Halobacteriovoraceae bacterium]